MTTQQGLAMLLFFIMGTFAFEYQCGALDSQKSCQNTDFICPKEQDCYIYCTASLACSGAKFLCPPDYGCFVYCTGSDDSCTEVTINAEQSNALSIQVGQYKNVMVSASIYVPNTGTHKTAQIDCGEGLTNPCNSMNIYSKYGVADVSIICKNSDCITDTILYCYNTKDADKEAYSTSCVMDCNKEFTQFSTDGRCSCADITHQCASMKTPPPTKTPTKVPTYKPSLSPTTSAPTTNNPTTAFPTKSPTIFPSKSPTKSPTKSPIMNVFDGGDNTGSNAKNNGGDNDTDNLSTHDSSILYVGIIIMAVLLYCTFIAFLFYREKTKIRKKHLELEMERMKITQNGGTTPIISTPKNDIVRIQSVSTGSNNIDNDSNILKSNSMSHVSYASDDNNQDNNIITEGGNDNNDQSDDEFEDMYDDENIKDGENGGQYSDGDTAITSVQTPQ